MRAGSGLKERGSYFLKSCTQWACFGNTRAWPFSYVPENGKKKGKTLGTANQETLFCLFKKENQKLIQEFLCKLEAKSLYFIITFLFLDTVFSVRVDKIWQQALWLCVWIRSPWHSSASINLNLLNPKQVHPGKEKERGKGVGRRLANCTIKIQIAASVISQWRKC